jgi:uncharacterized protein YjbI with pentapeptide repeats
MHGDFRSANFDGANLTGASLYGSDLRLATFVGADLSNACLVGCDVSGTDFSGANMHMADTQSIVSDATTMWKCAVNLSPTAYCGEPTLHLLTDPASRDLRGWNRWRQKFNECSITLDRADFTHVDLSGVNLSRLVLAGADFTGAKLTCADMSESVLDGACFNGANLEGAKLRRASFVDADVRGARLEGIDVTGTDMSGTSIWWCTPGITWDDETLWADGYAPIELLS